MSVTVTLRPSVLEQAGAGTVVGAVSIVSALADENDGTYCRIPNQYVQNGVDRVRVTFPAPSIPAGAKILGVAVRDRVRSSTSYITAPRGKHWLGCRSSSGGGGSDLDEWRQLFAGLTEVTVSSEWRNRTPVAMGDKAPNGQPWNTESLSSIFYEIGRANLGGEFLDITAIYLDITYQRISTLTATGPTSPNTASNPTVKWTHVSADQQQQERSRVAVYTAAQVAAGGFVPFTTEPIQATGTATGTAAERYWTTGPDTQWTLPNPLVDGLYTAYIQASTHWDGSGDFPTATASITWTRAAAAASPPPAAVLLSGSYSYDSQVVELAFEPGGPTPATTSFSVQAKRNGIDWLTLPFTVAADGTNTVYAEDPAADISADGTVPTVYRVIALAGATAALSPSNEISVTPLDDRNGWIDPDNPLLKSPIEIRAPQVGEGLEVTRKRTQLTVQPIGGEGEYQPARVMWGPYHGEEHKLTLQFMGGDDSETYWETVEKITRLSKTILWKRPDGTSIWGAVGAGTEGQDPKLKYDKVPGDIRTDHWKTLVVVFTQTKAPEGWG